MKIRIIYCMALITVSNALYSSQPNTAGKPWSWQNLKQMATNKWNQVTSPPKNITHAPDYSPWSWQHLKNLTTLAILPTPTAQALTQTHRRKFKEKMLQDEADAVADLVDTNDPLWKEFEKFDEHYDKNIQLANPNRVYDKSLPKEWRQAAKQELKERGINPRSVHFKSNNLDRDSFASSSSYTRIKKYPFLSPIYTTDIGLRLNQSMYNKKVAPLSLDAKQGILSHTAKHEATHLQLKHGLSLEKAKRYHLAKQTTPNLSPLITTIEKTADTLHTLESRENAANALTALKHGVGYSEHKSDIEIEKSYHDADLLHEKKRQAYSKARQLQKNIQQRPVNVSSIQSGQRLYNRAINAVSLPSRWYKNNSE